MIIKMISILSLALVSQLAISEASSTKSYTYNIEGSEQLQLMYHRGNQDMSGAIIGGLLGGAIQGSHEAGLDQKKEAILFEKYTFTNCFEPLEDGFKKKLMKKQIEHYSSEVVEVLDNGHIGIDVLECGFKISDYDSHKMSAFIRADLYIYNQGNGKAIRKEKVTVVGKNQFHVEALLADDDSVDAETEFSSVLKKAGRRIANKIIYMES